MCCGSGSSGGTGGHSRLIRHRKPYLIQILNGETWMTVARYRKEADRDGAMLTFQDKYPNNEFRASHV